MSDQDIRNALTIARGDLRLGYNLRGGVKTGALNAAVEALVNSAKKSPVKPAEAKVPAIAKQPEVVANPAPAQTTVTLADIAKQNNMTPEELGRTFTKVADPQTPFAEWQYTYQPHIPLDPAKTFDPGTLKVGDAIVNYFGDRSPAGTQTVEANGIKFQTPTTNEGGKDFGRDNFGREIPTHWASGPSIVTGLVNKGIRAQEASRALGYKDPRVFGTHVAMGPASGDFSTHTAEAVLGLLDRSKISKNNALDFDAFMREQGKKPLPEWPGLYASDEAIRNFLMARGAGDARIKFTKGMDIKRWNDAGLPDVGAARFATVAPELAAVPNHMTGAFIGQMAENPVVKNPTRSHRSYPVEIAGTYEGALENLIPRDKMFLDWSNQFDANYTAAPEKIVSAKNKSYDNKDAFQIVTPEWLDHFGQTLADIKRFGPEGKSEGGEVDEFDHDGYARGGYPNAGEGYDPQAEADALRLARETNPREEHAMFLGSKGARFSPMVQEALRLAEQMMKEGFGKKEILKDTVWFLDQQGMPKDYRGATNNPQWKTEINDLDARLKMSPEEFASSSFHHLGDVLDHPELFDLVPSMKTINVGPGNIRGAYRGYFDPKQNYIGLRGGMEPDLFLSTLLHEGQHGLQRATGIAGGGDPARMTQFTDNTMEAMNRELALKVAKELHNRGWEPWGSKIDALRPSLIESDPRFAEKSGWGRFIDDAYKADPVEHAAQTEAIRARNFGSDTAVDAYKRIVGENEAYNVENRLKQGITKDQMRDIHPEDTALHPFDQTFQQSPQ